MSSSAKAEDVDKLIEHACAGEPQMLMIDGVPVAIVLG